MNAISNTNYSFPGQTGFYSGKVRDVYYLGNGLMIMIASDRISAFDVILPAQIPYKGQVLNQIAEYFLNHTKDIVPNWLLASPHPMVSVGYQCVPFKVEMVVRGYLAGHAWRQYKNGIKTVCGVTLPDGLRENDKLPFPIITPTTKASEGHDEDISAMEIIEKGIVEEKIYRQLEDFSLKLFERGSQMAADKGLILVDTKYEFGLKDNQIFLIDEIHTPDSSRYFYSESYNSLQQQGLPQKQLSKEFVREWLISNGFQGKEGQKVPEMNQQWVQTISERYIELFNVVTGKKFEKKESVLNQNQIFDSINEFLLKESDTMLKKGKQN